MTETRKLAQQSWSPMWLATPVSPGQTRDRTLSRLRGLRSDLIDPAIAAHRGRVVKRTGDGSIIEFRSVVDAVRCAVEVQSGMVERNAGLPPERRSRVPHRRPSRRRGRGEADGDLMGDLASTSLRAWKVHLRARRGLSLRGRLSSRSRVGSISRSPILARKSSRTSPSRSGPIRLKSASLPS